MSESIGHIQTFGHLQTHEFKAVLLQNWPHMGTRVNTDKLIYNEQPVSEVIGEYQTTDHIGAHSHILTHEFAKNNHSQNS